LALQLVNVLEEACSTTGQFLISSEFTIMVFNSFIFLKYQQLTLLYGSQN